jgi:hypothetical protein
MAKWLSQCSPNLRRESSRWQEPAKFEMASLAQCVNQSPRSLARFAIAVSKCATQDAFGMLKCDVRMWPLQGCPDHDVGHTERPVNINGGESS